jgi:hypothetical protein
LKNKIASAFKFIDFSPICEICLPTFYKGAFAKKRKPQKSTSNTSVSLIKIAEFSKNDALHSQNYSVFLKSIQTLTSSIP